MPHKEVINFSVQEAHQEGRVKYNTRLWDAGYANNKHVLNGNWWWKLIKLHDGKWEGDATDLGFQRSLRAAVEVCYRFPAFLITCSKQGKDTYQSGIRKLILGNSPQVK